MQNLGSHATGPHRHRPAPAPTVSVIIPAYRAAPFIGGTLDSVLAQTLRDFEVIVVDDGSPDGDETERIILSRALGDGRDRVRLIRRENGGPAAARNTGLRAARGEFVAFLDGDDEWGAGFLDAQVQYLRAHPENPAVYSDAWIVGDPAAVGRTYMDMIPSSGEATLTALLSGRCTVITSGVMARRAAVMSAGMFDEAEPLLFVEDFDLWLRLARRAPLGYQRVPLVWRRVHAENASADNERILRGVLAVLQKLAQVAATLRADERIALAAARARVARELALHMAKDALARGDFVRSVSELRAIDAAGRGRKVRMAALALAIAPRVVRAAYMARDRVHAMRVARRAAHAAGSTPPFPSEALRSVRAEIVVPRTPLVDRPGIAAESWPGVGSTPPIVPPAYGDRPEPDDVRDAP